MPSMNVGSQVLEALGRSVSSDQTQVKTATNDLKALVQTYQVQVIQALVEIVKSAENVEPVTRLGAAIYLKNLVKSQWEVEDALAVESRRFLQGVIVPLIMNVRENNVKAMLLEVVETMARSDFPLEWATLLPELTTQYYAPFLASQVSVPGALTSEDLRVVYSAVEIAFTAMKKYETAARSNEILRQLKTILETAQKPLLDMLQWSSNTYLQILSKGTSADPQAALLLSRMTTSSLMIIKCLHGVDLPEYFEDNLGTLMNGCLFRLLQAPHSEVVDSLAEITSEGTLSDQMKTGCCELIREYVTKYSEEFMSYVVEGTRSIKVCLEQCPAASVHDTLVGSALGCIAAVAAVIWGPECDPLKQIPDLLTSLCSTILLRNIELRPCDIEAAEEEPLQFVREDLEGIQRGARREGAAQLIKSLLTHHEKEVCPTLVNAVDVSLARVHAPLTAIQPRERIMLQEATTFLVTSMSIKVSTRTRGITEINQFVPMAQYLKTEILPAITQPSVMPASTEEALLRGACLKFVCQFRRFISQEDIKQLLPFVIAHLASPNLIIYTHAASCLERLLTLKAPGQPFLNWQDPQVQAQVGEAVQPLLHLLKADVRLLDNEYVSRCLWRVVMLGRASVEIQAQRLRALVSLLEVVSGQSVNPIFTHYLFECVSSLSRILCIAVGSSPEAVELHRFVVDVLTKIIANQEASASAPYCYQTLGTLIDTLPLTAGTQADDWRGIYSPIVLGVLQEDRWKASTGNLPGIMNLLEAAMQRLWIFEKVLEENVQRLFIFFSTCLKYRAIVPAHTFEFANFLVIHFRQHTLGRFFIPMVQTLQAYLKKNTRETGIAYPAVLTFCGLTIAAALQSNGTIDLPLNQASTPDPIGALCDNNPTNLVGFLRTPWQPCATTLVKSMQERALMIAALIVMKSHPLAQISPQCVPMIDESLKTLAGVYRPDQQLATRSTRTAEEIESLQVTESEERQRLLETMAAEDERGVADMSAAYNKLATSTRRKPTELAELVSVDQLRLQLQSRGLVP